MDISSLDKNFVVSTDLGKDDIEWYDVENAPFELYGLASDAEAPFFRLPRAIASQASAGVGSLCMHTAGGRVRFSTDSPYIAIKAVYRGTGVMAHMAYTGTAGFDLYVDENGESEYACTFVPPAHMTDGYECLREMWPATRHKDEDLCYTLNMPLYNDVKKLYVGIKKGSKLGGGAKYRDIAPVAFYGSSITQGGCASRPGNSYEAMISRKYNVDHRNFGFSGNCKGETVLARYFSELDISIFVCDYDHNTPNAEHLEATYFPFYEEFRKKQPNIPYIMVTRTDCLWNSPAYVERCRDIIHNAYLKAKEQGDENVYFIDGGTIFAGEQRGSCVVDGGHPTDIGFLRMSEVIGALVGKLLENK